MIGIMEVPRIIKIRERKEGYRTRIFDSTAFSEWDLKRGTKYREYKVRVDFDARGVKKSERITDKVLERIIFRGRKTRLSPKLEREICEAVKQGKTGVKWEGEAISQWFDGGGREEKFYREVLVPEVLKNGGEISDILPQVHIFSFVNDRSVRINDERRVDFLVTNGEQKLVVEVDDESHNGHESKDFVRDELLKKNMVDVVRVRGNDFLDVKKAIERLYKNFINAEQKESDLARNIRIAHEFQGILVILLKNGVIKAGDKVYFLNKEIEQDVVSLAFLDLLELERNIAALYGEDTVLDKVKYERGGVVIARDFDEKSKERQVLFQEIRFPGAILNFGAERDMKKARRISPKTEVLEYLLNYLFRHEKFRPNQIDGVVRSLLKQDSIVLLPTGSGKSVIFQLLALILPQNVIVIEPLKSLMEDQIENLRKNGIDAVINASGEKKGYDRENMNDILLIGGFLLLYVTPERLQMEEFRRNLRRAGEKGVKFAVCALDEAHCVSEWGHDFRVAYLNIAATSRMIFENKGEKPVILALTGTASDNVLKDMMRDLNVEESGVVRPESFDRPEIHYRVVATGSEDKMACLNWLLSEVIPKDFGVESRNELLIPNGEETKAGIVFCIYKSGKTDFGVNAVFEGLNRLGCPGVVRYYATADEADIVNQNARDFKDNKAGLMVATKAFGMGIDKPNIRYTIHFGIPSSVEAYYQEAGRAGRDGQKSMSYIILSNDSPERNGELIKVAEIDDLKKELKKIGKKKQDDVNRLLFLHQRNFDKVQTVQDTDVVINMLGELKKKRVMLTAPSNLEFDRWQKVLYRMKILRTIDDYAVASYPNNEFLVEVGDFSAKKTIEAFKEYISKYQEGQVKAEIDKIRGKRFESQREFLVEMMDRLLQFVNGTFENSRRREIGNMLQLAEEVAEVAPEKQDEVMRRKILGHLGNTYKDLLVSLSKEETGVEKMMEILKGVRVNQVEQMLLETRRMLQTLPEHPGLLLLAGFLGVSDEDTNPIVAANDIKEGVKSAREKYGMSKKVVLDVVMDATSRVSFCAVDDKKFVQFFRIICEEFGVEFERKTRERLDDKFLKDYYALQMVNLQKMMFNKIEEMDLWTRKN